MEMINRARREELDAMVYGMSPRSAFTSRVVRKSPARGTTLFSKVTGSFGGVLIAAGQRLQAVR